ncbi:MAG: DUF484 family protein [Alteromonadaceae bacterium]|nr:DUF484 family protein [Alteromonadaceae bacterium]
MNKEQSDSLLIQTDDLPLSDDLIVSFLQENPGFFNRHPELVTSLRIKDNQRGTVSLVERHQQQLRQKIHGLEEEITELMSIANHNEQLFTLYSDLYLQLLDCHDANELLDCLYVATTEFLSLTGLKLWLSKSVGIFHHSIVVKDCGGIMQNRLTKDVYYFGRLQQAEQEMIFSVQTAGSVVLIKLTHDEEELGFLAISSEDAEHFDPRMDTLLLSQYRKLVAKLLHKQLAL